MDFDLAVHLQDDLFWRPMLSFVACISALLIWGKTAGVICWLGLSLVWHTLFVTLRDFFFLHCGTSFLYSCLYLHREHREGYGNLLMNSEGLGSSPSKLNTANSAEDSLQVSRAPLLDLAMHAEVGLEIYETSVKKMIHHLTFCKCRSSKWSWMLSNCDVN